VHFAASPAGAWGSRRSGDRRVPALFLRKQKKIFDVRSTAKMLGAPQRAERVE